MAHWTQVDGITGNDPTITHHRNMRYQGVASTITFPGGAGAWKLRSHATGAIVAQGGAVASGGTIPVSSSHPCGSYRLERYKADGTTYGGGGQLGIVRNVAGMPPMTTTAGSDTFANYVQQPLQQSSMLVGAQRLTNLDASLDPVTDANWWSLEADQLIASHKVNYLPFDTARPKHIYMHYPNGTGTRSTTGNYHANVTAAVASARYADVDMWEPKNEPTLDSTWAQEQRDFYLAVKAGRAAAKVLSFPSVTIGPNKHAGFRSFYAACVALGTCFDYVSFHSYNGTMGDLTAARQTWDGFVGVLAEYGLHTLPRIHSEAGSFFHKEDGAGTYLRQTRQLMLDILINEQYGVAKERYHWFDGFYENPDAPPGQPVGYPSFLALSGPTPAYVATYNLSQELLGTSFEARLDFGTVDNDFVIGSRYRRADSTGLVVLMAPGKKDHPVTLQITGGTPSSLVTVDVWGNTGTVAVTGGLVQATATLLPTYYRLPAGVSATPVGGDTRWGAKRSTGASAYVNAKPVSVGDFTDTFDRANGAVGNGWTSWGSVGSVVIDANQLAKTSGNFIPGGIVRDIGSANGHIVLTASNNEAGIIFRYTDANNFWSIRDSNLIKRQAGVDTYMATPNLGTTGAEQHVILTGSNIYVFIEGGAGGSRELVDSFNSTATTHGVFLGTTATRADSFRYFDTSDGSWRSGSLKQVLDGPYRNNLVYDGDNSGGPLSSWFSQTTVDSDGADATVTVELVGSQWTDRMLVHGGTPWTWAGPPMDFDVQALEADGTAWTTVATVVRTPEIVAVRSAIQDGANALYDSYWDDENVYEVTFPRRQTSALRLYIRKIAYGGTPTKEAYNAFGFTYNGQPVTAGRGWNDPRISLQRLSVWDGGNAPVGPVPWLSRYEVRIG